MKFINGNWLMADGVRPGYDCSVFDWDADADSLTLYLAERPGISRGNAISLPYDTMTVTSPTEDVIRVNLVHFKGSVKNKPAFELAELPAPKVSVKADPPAFSFSSRYLEMRANREEPFEIAFYGDGKLLTKSGFRAIGRMETAGGAYMEEQLSLNVGDRVVGLGERFSPFVKNGSSVDIWNEDGGTGTWQAYKNVPFYMVVPSGIDDATGGCYGVFVNSSDRVSYEVETQRNFTVGISVPGEELEYFLIYGKNPKDVLAKYTALTGRAPLVPSWSMGLWLSTSFTTDYDEKTVMGFLDGMKERDIPLRTFHYDCYWMRENEWCNFKWDERFFPDPEGMLKRLHDRGLKVCVWINSYVAQKSYMFDEGLENGYFIKNLDGTPWQNDDWQAGKAIVDFTNPDAWRWYQEKLRALLKMGVDCFKTDFGERIPVDGVKYFDGSDPHKMHNYYTYLYNKCVYEVVKQERGEGDALLFARSATVGGQKFPVHWGGDCFSNYQAMAESLRAGLSFGLSGFGYWAHDIGGFEATSTPDVYKRWVQFGLLSSHSRLHGSGSYRVPWNYDEESVDVLRFFTKLKARLMPYLYSVAAETRDLGLPVMRAMLLEFPDDQVAVGLDRQYMLGANLLVAPLFNDQGLGNYYLPEGEWTHLLSGETRNGGKFYREAYDYMSLPLFARPCSIMPLGARDDVPDYDYDDGVTFRIFPGENGTEASFTITNYDGTKGAGLTVHFLENSAVYEYVPGAGGAKPFKVQLGNTITDGDVNGGKISF